MAGYKFLQEEAYAHIREQIVTGVLQEDQIYSETKLAAMIGISRTPVKDALVRLSQEKLIDILPSRGFRLHQMSEEDIWSTYQLRTAVEGFCVLHLAHRKDTPEGRECLGRLADSVERMAALPEEIPIDEVWAEDLSFHRQLVEFAGNAEFLQLFESYNHRMSVIARRSFLSPHRREAALREHRDIVEAIRDCRDRDDMAAFAAVRVHMESSRDIVLREQQAKGE